MTIHADAVIIGAGPCGLFQVFELGLLDIRAHIIDALPAPGGQCTELYPDKPIYDIPALPVCGAQELIDRLMEQIKPFSPTFHLGQQVTTLTPQEDGSFYLKTSAGEEFIARSVIIAGGVGAFEPVRLKVPGVDRFEGESLFYSIKDPSRHHGKELVVLGGGDSALDWALSLYEPAESLLLVHRSEKFRAAPASVARMHALCEDYQMQFMVGNVTGLREADGRLTGVDVTGGDGVLRRVDCDHLLVFFGLSPKLGPIAEWGLELNKNQIIVDTERFETNVPGIHAVGDVNWYPGKKKLILSGFHEAALAAFAIKSRLNPGKKVHLQYTTTSPVMHKRLGVDDPYAED
ncbi:MAG: NAD(P)/FAD-dependent oxidoreductase [Pseudomonadota bacterium]|nr:NAD(P)/FAD-dependent oxidoreductase [Pseudomonadota bacterium]HJO35497.1 NAD(P)/FAD-dependent oxidoreductase [Gammaproteobacteria bacterium]